jgi:hypothetical protein
MQSRYQGSEPASLFVVQVIWLVFYAIAIVGALAWPRSTEMPETAAVVDNTPVSGVQ